MRGSCSIDARMAEQFTRRFKLVRVEKGFMKKDAPTLNVQINNINISQTNVHNHTQIYNDPEKIRRNEKMARNLKYSIDLNDY